MPRKRQRRETCHRVFMITGVPTKEKVLLGKQIQKLGAVFTDSDVFHSNTTHVICGKLSRTEKFLGALALGLWVVRPGYVEASVSEGRWVEEGAWEWSSLQEGPDQQLAVAAKRNRWRASTSTEKIFTDWQGAVVMKDTKQQNVYKRLLVCGGARLHDVKLPSQNPERESQYLTYLFVDPTTAPLTQSLQDYGVFCLNAVYISDSILLHPMPDPLRYVLRPDTVPSLEASFNHATVVGSSKNVPSLETSNNSIVVGSSKANTAGTSAGTSDFLSASRDRGSDDDGILFSQCTLSQISPGPACPLPGKVVCKKEAASSSDEFSIISVPSSSDDDVMLISDGEGGRGGGRVGALPSPQSRLVRSKETSLESLLFNTGKKKANQRSVPGASPSKTKASATATHSSPSKTKASTVTPHSSPSKTKASAVTPHSSPSRTKASAVTPHSSPSRAKASAVTPHSSPSKIKASTVTPHSSPSRTKASAVTPHSSPFKIKASPIKLHSSPYMTKASAVTPHSSPSKSKASTEAAASSSSPLKLSPKQMKTAYVSVVDLMKEMKSLKAEMRKSPAKQTLLPKTPGKVQKTLRNWFTPSGKENSRAQNPAAETQTSSSGDAAMSAVGKEPNRTGEFSTRKCVTRQTVTEVSLPSSLVPNVSNHSSQDNVPLVNSKSELNQEVTKLLHSPQKNSLDEPVPKRDPSKSDAKLSLELPASGICVENGLHKSRSPSRNNVAAKKSFPRKAPTARQSKRENQPTEKMTSYKSALRKKRKVGDKVSPAEDEPSTGVGDNVALTEPQPVKRPKTVRGLGNKLLTHSTPAPDPGSSSSTDVVTASKPTVGSVGSDSVALANQASQPVSADTADRTENSAITSRTSPESSSNTTDHPAKTEKTSLGSDNVCPAEAGKKSDNCGKVCARWRLSNVSFPGQVDVGESGTTRLDDVTSRQTPESLTFMVGGSVDEEDFVFAVTTARALSTLCPSADVIRHLITVVKKAGDATIVDQAYALLRGWLDQYPPVTSTLRALYEEALGLGDWEVCRSIIEAAVQDAEARVTGGQTDQAFSPALLVLRFVIDILEKNFLHFAHRASKQARTSCLVVRCLWSPSYQVYPNARTRELLNFLETTFKQLGSPQACWREVLTLVSMATQCCHLADNGWQWTVTGQVDRCSSAMTSQLAHAITGGGVDSTAGLQQVLGCLSPPWLLRQVSAVLLEDYDDYLVSGGLGASEPVTFNKIVQHYFFLLPKLSAQGSNIVEPRRRRKGGHTRQSENQAPALDPKLVKKINKKNPKGETELHLAAKRNNIALLKQILTVPGINVNIQDHAGWTSLHEACNHGNIECVKALLKFKPSSTLDNFFNSDRGGRQRRVDVNLSNADGITPLHDAVIANHISVVKLLLKYGGSGMLKARTQLGYTPLDLATTEEMRQLLNRDSLELSLSQESFSQELDSQDRESVPSAFLYREVVESSEGGPQLTVALDDARKFLTLLTLLLRAHIQVQRQERREVKASAESGEPKSHSFHAQCLRRHLQKITTADVFSSLTLHFCLLEALLGQCS